MTGREAMLGRIRAALRVTGAEIRRNATVDDRLRKAPRGVIPARARGPESERVALFTRMAEKVFATVARVEHAEDVPAAVADYLRDHSLRSAVRTGEDWRLMKLPWQRTAVEVTQGASDGTHAGGLSHALAAVAETGTAVLVSGAANPTAVAVLPETHIGVVRTGDSVGAH